MTYTFTLRLTLRFVVLVTGATALVLAAGGILLRQQAHNNLVEMHEVEGEELGEILGDAALSPEEVHRRVSHDADSDVALFFIQISNLQGKVAYRSANLGHVFLPVLEGHDPSWVMDMPTGARVLISEFQNGNWRIQVASRLEQSEQMLRDYAKVCGLMLFAVAALSVIMGYQFSRHTLRPVRAIEATARRIRGDNLSERIPVAAGYGELTALIQLLNDTFDRLQRSFDQVQRFTADASHELKTPLSLARLNAEKLQRRLEQDPESEALAAEVLDEIARLNRIIESLLFLAKTEGGALQIPRRDIELAPFVAEFAEDAQVLARDAGLQFTLGRNEEGKLSGDPGLLRQLLLNLVSNAFSVSAAEGKVTLESFRNGKEWWFVLTDEGPGLPADQLERVFERFVRYQAQTSNAARAGTGLGLAICRGIAELHGGRIRAVNRTDRTGLRMEVQLPLPAAVT